MSINRVVISGNLTRDPELRATAGGTQILNFGIAVNDRMRNQQTGEFEDRPNFVDCVVFGARAEALSRLLSKGMKVAIEGKLRYSSWEKDGQKRSKLEVVVDEIEFLSQRGQQGGQGDYAQPQQYQQPAYAAPAPAAPVYSAPAPAAPAAAPAPAPAPAPQQQAPAAGVPSDEGYFDAEIPF